jgi:hypothetical protein
VRAYSRSGDDLGLARLRWPNIGLGDILELDEGGGLARVVDFVHAPAGSAIGPLVKVAPLS